MMNSIRCLALMFTTSASLGLATVSTQAQEPSQAATASQGGLEVGTEAPAFTLKDQDGSERSLADFLKKDDKVALVFFRSADWCPFCRKQLMGLQTDIQAFDDAGIQLVGISYDSPEVLKTFATKNKITFPLLSDPGSKTIDAYHIRNTSAKGKAEGVPNPGTFVLTPAGKIGAKLFQDGYRDRASTSTMIAAAKEVK